MQVAIIGGGIAGLAAADQLLNAYSFASVHVYEAGERVGGRIRSVVVDDCDYPLGAQYVHNSSTELFKLARSLDLMPSRRVRACAFFFFVWLSACAQAVRRLLKLDEVYLLPGGKKMPRSIVCSLYKFMKEAGAVLEESGDELAASDGHFTVAEFFVRQYNEFIKVGGVELFSS